MSLPESGAPGFPELDSFGPATAWSAFINGRKELKNAHLASTSNMHALMCEAGGTDSRGSVCIL